MKFSNPHSNSNKVAYINDARMASLIEMHAASSRHDFLYSYTTATYIDRYMFFAITINVHLNKCKLTNKFMCLF